MRRSFLHQAIIPGTNHPRMLTTLREASKRGVPIIVFNPLRERGLERFTSPQDPIEMLTLDSTPIASSYYLVKVGGDIAVLKGMMKTLLALDAKAWPKAAPAFSTVISSGTIQPGSMNCWLTSMRPPGTRS